MEANRWLLAEVEDRTGLHLVQVAGIAPVLGRGTYGQDQVRFSYLDDSAQLEVGPRLGDDAYGEGVRLYAEVDHVVGRPWADDLDELVLVDLLDRLTALLRPVEEWELGTHRQRVLAGVEQSLLDVGLDGPAAVG